MRTLTWSSSGRVILGFLLLLTPAIASGQPPPEGGFGPNVIVDVQIVAIPEALAWPLIAAFSGSKEAAEKGYQELAKLIAEKRAVIVAWPRTIGKGGERAFSQQQEEIRFATSYEAPQVAWTSSEAGGGALKLPPKVDLTTLEAVPKDFATATTGVTLETDATIVGRFRPFECECTAQSQAIARVQQSDDRKRTSGKNFRRTTALSHEQRSTIFEHENRRARVARRASHPRAC